MIAKIIGYVLIAVGLIGLALVWSGISTLTPTTGSTLTADAAARTIEVIFCGIMLIVSLVLLGIGAIAVKK